MHAEFESQAAYAMLSTFAVEMLKRLPIFPWINQHSDALNRTLSVGLAMLGAAGFTIDFSGSVVAGGTLTVAIPSLDKVIQFATHALLQFPLQEAAYRSVVKPMLNGKKAATVPPAE